MKTQRRETIVQYDGEVTGCQEHQRRFFRRGARMNIHLEVFSLVALSVTNDHDRQGLSFCSADAPLYFVTGSVSFCTPLSIQLRLCHHLLYVGIVLPYVLLFNLFAKHLLCTRHR